MRRPRLRLTTWLTGTVLVLLPLLAVLQYRWLTQIGAETRSQMRAVATNAMSAMAADLAFEVGRAWRERPAAAAGAAAKAGDSTAARPLVSDALVIDRLESRAPRVRRWNLDAGLCEAAAWPAGYDTVEAETRRAFAPASSREVHHLADSLDRMSTALGVVAVPLPDGDEWHAVARPPCDDLHPGVVLFRLDPAVLGRTLLPEVVRRHLDALEGHGFRFAIVAGPSHDRVIYASAGADAAVLAAAPDVFMPLTFDANDGPERRRPEMGWRGGDRDLRPRGGGRGPGPRRAGNGGWLLVAQHRAGSLDAAVAGLRARNLGISFGILALLGVAVALIAANARRAERLGRQQVEFVAGVSHEMRTPVSAIEVAARNLEDGLIAEPARVRRYGQVIGAEARRLSETVERVLQFAAIEAGRGRGTATDVDLAALVGEVLNRARSEHPAASIEAETPSGLVARADPVILRSCVQNLVENALKYGGAPGWVRVRVAQQDGGRREGCVAVEDRGPGIDGADLAHVFEPFYRGRLATDRRIPGSGLGLHIVKRSIEHLGGRVDMSTRHGAGTTVTLFIPLRTEDGNDREPTTHPADRG